VSGTLAHLPLTGGAPRDLVEDTYAADWSPDGKQLAISRRHIGELAQLEYPVGRVLWRAPDHDTAIGDVRVSRTGDRIAFVLHSRAPDDRGTLMIIDAAGGEPRAVGHEFASLKGMAWSPSGSELWFTGATTGAHRALMAMTLDGKERKLFNAPGSLMLHDVSGDGRVLIAADLTNRRVLVKAPGSSPGTATTEHDLTPYDWSLLRDLSSDGKTVIMVDESDTAATTYQIYARPTDGGPAVHIAEGGSRFDSLSPDGKWLVTGTAEGTLELIPTGPGQARTLPLGKFNARLGATWLPDLRLVYGARLSAEKPFVLYAEDVLHGGEAQPLGVQGNLQGQNSRMVPPSPDGRWLPIVDGNRLALFPLPGGGPPVPLPAIAPDDYPLGWASDSRSIYVRRHWPSTPAVVERVSVETGKSESFAELTPPDVGAFSAIGTVLVTPRGDAYAYDVVNFSSELYLLTDLK
jgi:hypothetical protein